MHPKNDMLRAYLDGALSSKHMDQVRAHLSHCAGCQARMDEITRRAQTAQQRLDVLAPEPLEQPRPPQAAYARFQQKNRFATTRKEQFHTMLKQRPFWTAAAVVVILALALTLTPVRAWASSFLSLFRVQNITVVEFDPQAADLNRQGLEANRERIEAIMADLNIDEGGEPQEVSGVEEAAALAGYTPRLPAGFSDAQLVVKPGANGSYTINRQEIQAVLEAVGTDVRIPASVDGKLVTVEVFPAVLASQGCPEGDVPDSALPGSCLILAQMPSPVIDAPDGLNVQAIGSAMLQFLGYSKAEANALAEQIDWTTTLILPIPQGEDLKYREIPVDGVTGTFIEDESGTYMLLWVKEGVIYGLRGTGSLEDALETASSLP